MGHLIETRLRAAARKQGDVGVIVFIRNLRVSVQKLISDWQKSFRIA